MKNTTTKTKIIILSAIAILVILLVGFLVYRNKENGDGAGLFSNIFSILPSSRDTTEVEAISGVSLDKNDPVYISGISENGKPIVSLYTGNLSDLEKIYGYALKKYSAGDIGEFKFNEKYKYDSDISTEELISVIDYKFECNDGIDNDNDGTVDADDSVCHTDGDINKEYLPNYYSESFLLPEVKNFDFTDTGTSELGNNDEYKEGEFKGACSDSKDNDEDGFIDEKDPECHLDGELDKEYLPDHYSEERYVNSYIDLSAGNVTFQTVKTDEKATFYSTISNYGTNKTQKGFSAFFSIKKVGEGVEDVYSETVNIPEISSREDFVTSISFAVKDTEEYKIRACADKKDASDVGEISEFNEDNNCGSWVSFKADSSIPGPDEEDLPECRDEKDNDGDEKIDRQDLNCHVGGTIDGEYLPDYDSESTDSYECSDTIDNDGDGTIDEDDLACREGGVSNGTYLPEYNSESMYSYQCNDTIDNDSDRKIDASDPECHEGGTLSGDYVSTNDSESVAPAKPNICLSLDPLEFTDEEKAELDNLLRRFYLIAPTLKDSADIKLVYNEIERYQNLKDEIETLTKACYSETAELKKTGNGKDIIQYGNPWFNYQVRGSYLENESDETLSKYKPQCVYSPAKEKDGGNKALTKGSSNAVANFLSNLFGNEPTEEEKEKICNTLGKTNSRLLCEMYDGTSEDNTNKLLGQLGILTTGAIDPASSMITLGIGSIIEMLQGDDYYYTGCKFVTDGKADLEEYEGLLNVW